MPNPATKTNNDTRLFEAKIRLRMESLPDRKEIRVLEAFGGEGLLWKAVKRKCSGKMIKTLSIDKNQYRRVQLQGDNVKFLRSFDLSHFDIIDLDAWGSPVAQLEILFERGYKGVVHCTFIQTMQGNIPKAVLRANGISNEMLEKVQVLFTKNAIEKVLNYLAFRGVKQVKKITENRKNYLWFSLDK